MVKKIVHLLVQFAMILLIILVSAVFISGSIVLNSKEFFSLFLSLMVMLLLMLVWAYIIDKQIYKQEDETEKN